MNRPQAGGGGGGVVVDSEAMARARYFAYAQRRTMPPRCNPFGILLLVLSLGMVFIGLTMTIIANWPGATSIGENPLKVAGPVLLAVGGALFVLGIILVIYLNKREQERWERKLTNLAADRLGSSSKEILVQRQVPLAAEDRGYKRQPGDGSDTTTGKYGGPKDDPSSSRSSSAYVMKGRYSSSTVEMAPDPSRKPDISGKVNGGSIDSLNKVPDPMRIQKKRNTPRKSESSNGSVNQSYSSDAGEADLGVPGMLMPSRQSRPGGHANAYSNDVYESEEREPNEQKKKRKGATDGAARRPGGKSSKEGRGGQQQSDGGVSSDPIREAITRGTAHIYSPDPQQLRVHIKAQQGTAIHITPSATPPLSRHSHQRTERQSLNTSGETEI